MVRTVSLRSRVLRTLAVAATAAGVLAPLPVAAPVAAPAAVGVVTRHVSGGHAVTAGTTYTTATGASYAFSAAVGGKPVRWNPCAPIHWRFNLDHRPTGGLSAVATAVAAVAAATGTTWVYDGTTTAVPSSGWLPKTSTQKAVLIGWTDGSASDLLRSKPASVLGMTRTTWFSRTTSTGTVAATRGAVVALDRTNALPVTGRDSWTTVAMHELGHAMGLAHPADSGELMNAVLSPALSGYQTGDRSGLYRLGRSQGCINF